MKIVHLACVAPPQTGGIGQVPFFEVDALRGRGIEATVLAPAIRGLASAPPIERVRTWFSFRNLACLDARSILAATADADVVHLHYPFYGTAGLMARLRRTGQIRRLVLTLHMDATAPGLPGLTFDLHRQLFQSQILKAADALIVSSLDYAKHASFAACVAERPADVLELPFAIDEHRFSPGSMDRVRYGIPQEVSVISFVGGMDRPHAFKGVDILLKAIARLSSNVWCVLAGEGELRPSYERLAKQLGIASRVRFLGRVPSSDLPDVYRLSDLFVLPSVSGAEAFGLVALEAQACGIPVVASELPGVRTVVENGVTGILVPPRDDVALADRIRVLIGEEFRRREMEKAARERVLRRFTPEKHIDALIALYQRVCGSPS